jgi:hypothetical protein
MSWIEVQFLDQASQALQQCRQVLKWTYAFAYYLARNNLTEIFEDNQKDLEMAVENLSEMFEKPIDQLQTLKVDMMDKTSYCTKRRIILLNDTAENLKAGTWENPARPLRGYRQLSSWHCDHPVLRLADHPGMGPTFMITANTKNRQLGFQCASDLVWSDTQFQPILLSFTRRLRHYGCHNVMTTGLLMITSWSATAPGSYPAERCPSRHRALRPLQ